MSYTESLKIFLLPFLFSLVVAAQSSSEIDSKIRSHVENKDYAAAILELQTLERTDKKTFSLNNYDYLLARMAEKTGDYASAAANYQAVAARNSVLSEYALRHLGQIYRASGNLFLERIYLQKLLTLFPDSLLKVATAQRLTRSYFDSQDYETAIRLLNNPLPVTRSGSQPQKRTDAQPTTDDRQTRENLVLLGQAYLQTNRVNEAREIFTRLVNNSPNQTQPDDYALAGAMALDEIAVGKDNFGKSVPTLADAEHFRRASIYQFNRSFVLARLHYQTIVKSHPTSNYVADALYQIGRGFAQERNFDEAVNWYERVQAEFPNDPISKDALSQAAAAYSRVNKPKEAISRYQKFIERYADASNLDRAYLNLIDVLRDTGANTDALKWTAITQEKFRGEVSEALALFAQARIHLAQNDWQNALADLKNLQGLPDLGTRVPGGTNKSEIVFLKGFVLENLNRYPEAIEIYLSLPDGRNEYYGWRATERLKLLARDEKTQAFTIQQTNELMKNIETRNAEAQRKAAQAVLRLTENANVRAQMFAIVRGAYATLPDYQKVPNGKVLELGRKEVLKENRQTVSVNYRRNIADELLFLGLYDEAAPELESSRQLTTDSQPKENPTAKVEIQKPKTEDPKDFNYTLAVFYKRGDMAHRAVSYIEPLWKTIPADYEIELIPREQLELLYPAPYSDSLLKYAAPEAVDPRFMLAIMRQESRFRADVKSNAAARGLMQFISTTADKIAGQLNRENFKQDELYNPPTAILFGSQYLSNLFKIFPNQPAAVAASYNGGEDNMARWLARSKSDNPDRYVSETVFSQSKDYVYKVMAAYRVYQLLYNEQLKVK